MPQFGDDIYLGTAVAPQPNQTTPSPMSVGVGPMGRTFAWDVVPVALNTTGIAAAQLLGAAGNLALTAGTGATLVTRPDGVLAIQLDVPRCVTLTVATTDQSAITFTIYGYDIYGQPMSAQRAGPNANTVATTKAFYQITRVAASAAIATNGVSVGFNDKLGVPVVVKNAVHVAAVKYNSTLAQDAGTFVAADVTTPATVSTTDVRGCYTPSSACDGAKRLVMSITVTSGACGPQATRVNAFGVDQV